MLRMEVANGTHGQIESFLAIMLLEEKKMTHPLQYHRRLRILQPLHVLRHRRHVKPDEMLVLSRDEQYGRLDLADLFVVELLPPRPPGGWRLGHRVDLKREKGKIHRVDPKFAS